MDKAIVTGYAALAVSFPLLLWLVIDGRLPAYLFAVVVVILAMGLVLLGIALVATLLSMGRSRERRHIALLGAAVLAVWLLALLIDYAD